jgi:2,2-dialkylglycine decarboxylase (pyruvate)
LQQRHACIGDVRGRGLLLGLEFTAAGSQPAAALSDAVTDVALKLGLSANIVRAGASGGTMRIAPPLTVTDSEIDLGVELLDAAIVRVMKALRRPAGDHDTREQGQAAG